GAGQRPGAAGCAVVGDGGVCPLPMASSPTPGLMCSRSWGPRAPSSLSINCLKEIVREDHYLARNGFRFANAFFGTSGHHRTDGVRPRGEQLTEMHLRFGCDLPRDLFQQESAELRGERIRGSVNEEAVEIVCVLVHK